MKVFIYSTHTLWPHHAETELELMQQHLTAGDEVHRFVCNRHFATCDANLDHRLHACLRCMDKQTIGQNLLEGGNKVIVHPIYSKKHFSQAHQQLFNYTDITQFKELKIDTFDIGYAVSSSVISALREPKPDIRKNELLFKNFFYSSLALYYASLEQIETHQPDLIYAFNGRVAHSKPILRAAQKLGIECRIHERGCDINHYGITVNTTPHDIENFQTQMQNKWDAAASPERERIGAEFYEERVRGKEQGWVSFVKEQQKDLLPINWDPTKHNIAIFNTSEDEYESIGPEWKNHLYETQAEGIEKILKSFLMHQQFHFYLRIHPNLRGLDNKQLEEAHALSRYNNLTIIDADSPVSTYTLMTHAEKTITFGSSTGIEATYWQKPSILLGKSFYYYLDVSYKPNNHEEAVALIKSTLLNKSKNDALKYGYYFKTFGISFQIYKPTGFLSGTFKNIDLDTVSSFKTQLFEKFYSISVIKQLYGLKKHFKILLS